MQKSQLSCVSVFHRRWLSSEAGTLSCSTSENCGISASLCWIPYCTPCCSPGRGVEHISSTGEHADGEEFTRNCKGSQFKQARIRIKCVATWIGVWFFEVSYSPSVHSAHAVNKPDPQKSLLLKHDVPNSICKYPTLVDSTCRSSCGRW